MTDQELADLNAMKQRIQEIKNNAFDIMRSLDRADERELKIYGYRNMTNAEAVRMCFQYTLRQIEKLAKDYVRKYPD